jgi:hypothetical protein
MSVVHAVGTWLLSGLWRQPARDPGRASSCPGNNRCPCYHSSCYDQGLLVLHPLASKEGRPGSRNHQDVLLLTLLLLLLLLDNCRMRVVSL